MSNDKTSTIAPITHDMVDRMMAEMDRQLLKGSTNIWQEACEIARYNIAHQILEAALKKKA